jgi:hypothetical protein
MISPTPYRATTPVLVRTARLGGVVTPQERLNRMLQKTDRATRRDACRCLLENLHPAEPVAFPFHRIPALDRETEQPARSCFGKIDPEQHNITASHRVHPQPISRTSATHNNHSQAPGSPTGNSGRCPNSMAAEPVPTTEVPTRDQMAAPQSGDGGSWLSAPDPPPRPHVSYAGHHRADVRRERNRLEYSSQRPGKSQFVTRACPARTSVGESVVRADLGSGSRAADRRIGAPPPHRLAIKNSGGRRVGRGAVRCARPQYRRPRSPTSKQVKDRAPSGWAARSDRSAPMAQPACPPSSRPIFSRVPNRV